MEYGPEVINVLVSTMMPILAKEHEFANSLAYFGIDKQEMHHHYQFERSHLIVAAKPWLSEDERKAIIDGDNLPTPGAERFGGFWRSTEFNPIVLEAAWGRGGFEFRKHLSAANEAEAAFLYRGVILFDDMKLRSPGDYKTLMLAGQMELDGIDREYIVSTLGLDGA